MTPHNRFAVTPTPRMVWLSLFVAALLLAGDRCFRCGRHGGARPVILDTDICDDIDDTWALALLTQSPELDCKLVTTAVGNTEIKAKVVAKFLDETGYAKIPVGIGVKQRDGGHRHTDWAKDYDLASYLGGVHKDGVGALIDVVMTSPQRVTIIAIGPLPNIGAALQREPRIAEKADFIGMHGSIYKGYGGKSTPDPEYNVRADVPACRRVFTAPLGHHDYAAGYVRPRWCSAATSIRRSSDAITPLRRTCCRTIDSGRRTACGIRTRRSTKRS